MMGPRRADPLDRPRLAGRFTDSAGTARVRDCQRAPTLATAIAGGA